MPKLRYSPASVSDLKEVATYIAEHDPAAARRWRERIHSKCRLLAKYPELGDARPELGHGVRSTYAGSYVIYFRRVAEAVEIARVIRGDRDTRSLG